jgi:REP element-mobilizing transposase RayT
MSGEGARNGGTGFQPVSEELVISRRNLPHWQMGGATYFLTFRLASARQLLSEAERSIVKQAILFWNGKKWNVHMLTVMPDHVHIIATPLEMSTKRWFSLSEILHSVKRHTARVINMQRGQIGSPLWQSEAFDRMIRDSDEYDEKARYIFNNAIKSGLVEDGWQYDGFWCIAEQ